MITEDYVSFETAKLLKEKWFKFIEDKDELSKAYIHAYTKEGKEVWGCYSPDYYPCITMNMAMKWLRETYEIIPIILTGGDSQNPFYYWFRIDTIIEGKLKDAIYREDEKEYSSYEETCEAAIKYCLENLI